MPIEDKPAEPEVVLTEDDVEAGSSIETGPQTPNGESL